MSLRDKLGIFVLTKEEQRTIAFIVLMVVLGLLTKHYRNRHTEQAKLPNDEVVAVAAATASPVPRSRAPRNR